MKCACCGEREASVFISRSGPASGDSVLALCESCARKRGLAADKDRIEINIEDLLLSSNENNSEAKPARCPGCGSLLDDLRRSGKLGCAVCADALHSDLERHFRAKADAPFFRDHPFNVPRWAKDPKYRAEYGKKPPVPRTNEPQGGVGAVVAALENAAAQTGTRQDAGTLQPASDAARKKGKGGRKSKETEKAQSEAAQPGSSRLRLSLAEKRKSSAPSAGIRISLDTNIADGIVESSLLSDICGLAKKGPETSMEARRSAQQGGAAVLWTEARISRNFDGVPFDQVFAPDVDGLVSAPLSEVSDPVKKALIESSRVSRNYALMPRARIGIDSEPRRCFLLGKMDHLCAVSHIQGLDAPLALDLAKKGIEEKNWTREFAFDPDFGYLSSKVENCGTGAVLSAELHLPALEASGLLERAVKSLMGAGYIVRGLYGAGDASSAGCLYEVSTGWSYGAGAAEIAGAFGSAILRVAESELHTQNELVSKELEELQDRAGRALGVLQNCRFIDSLEAVDLLSPLRLAALCGCLKGPDAERIALIMHALGPASLALLYKEEGNAAPLPEEQAQGSIRAEDMRRAQWLSAEFAGAELLRPTAKKE